MAKAVRDADVIMMLRIQLERQSGSCFPSVREYASLYGLDEAKLVLITDAAYLARPKVREALAVMDANNGEIWAKLDAGTEDYFRLIDRPNVTLQAVVANVLDAARVRLKVEALGGFAYNAEQSFYSFFLLLALLFLVLKDREDTLKNNLLAGLAIGASLLVRTPLLLFPPLVVLSGRFWKTGLPEGRAARELAFLAASYALLLPWGALNQSVSGKFSLFDDRRAACNLITAAKGSVYTMNGNPFRLAGIGEEDSAFDYFVRETARAPLDHALTAVKRLWHIFLFHPLLSGLFLLALLKNRFRDGPAFGLPVYFVLVHSLLSIEARYFYPLVYLLPPLIAAGLLRGGQETVEQPFLMILGQVDDPGQGIDRGRLVVEAADRAQRHRLDQLGGARRHLEHPAMTVGELVDERALGLLAAEPRTPGRGAAGAVAQRAGEAEVAALDGGAVAVEQQGRGAALGHRIGGRIEHLRPDGRGQQLVPGAEGAILVIGPEFMVAHQDGAAAREELPGFFK